MSRCPVVASADLAMMQSIVLRLSRLRKSLALGSFLVCCFSSAVASEVLFLAGHSADGTQMPTAIIDDPSQILVAAARACNAHPSSTLKLMEAGSGRVLKTWLCPLSSMVKVPAEEGMSVITAGVPDQLIQNDVDYRMRLQQTLASRLPAVDMGCMFVVRQLPGGSILDVEFPSCDLPAEGKKAIRSELRGGQLPYAGFESVFSRELVVVVCDEACQTSSREK